MQEIWQGKLDAYCIHERLVEGRFGDTFRATRIRDDLNVIIKTVELDGELDWSRISLFAREAARLRRLSHPAIASYIDDFVVDLPGKPRDRVALVQLPGRGRPLIKHELPMTEQQALAWFEPLLEALCAMHEQLTPIVHGDLDAGNILLDEGGAVCLVDLATVRHAMLPPLHLARGLYAGGLSYTAPEQRMGRPEPATDLYAAAMTYLVARTGLLPEQLPTRGVGVVLDELGVTLDPAVRSLLEPMLEPDPLRRTRDARVALRAVQLARAVQAQRSATISLHDRGEDAAPQPIALRPSGHDALLDQLDAWAGYDSRWPGYRVSIADAWRSPALGALDRLHAFACAPSGGHMVFAHERQAVVVDAKLALRAEVTADELIRRVAISADGRRLVLLSGHDTLTFYEVGTSAWAKHSARVVGMWPGHSPLVFSPHQDLVATGDDDQLDIYRFDTGKLVSRSAVDARHGIVFAPNNHDVFAIGEQIITHIVDGELRSSYEAHGLAFLPDGRSVALVDDEGLWIAPWQGSLNTITRQGYKIPLSGAQQTGQLSLIRVSPDGQRALVAGHAGGMVWVDLAQRVAVSFDAERSTLTSGVKLLEAGWSADGQRLHVHGTLPVHAAPGIPSTGAVLAWRGRAPALVGAFAWRSTRLALISAQGFFGDLQRTRHTSAGGQGWDRLGLAIGAIEGEDIEAQLSSEDSARYAEFSARRGFIGALIGAPQRWPLIDDASTLIAIMPQIIREAVEASPGGAVAAQTLHTKIMAHQRDSADQLTRGRIALREALPEGPAQRLRWLGFEDAERGEQPAPHTRAASAEAQDEAPAPRSHAAAPPAAALVPAKKQPQPSPTRPTRKAPEEDAMITQVRDANALVLARRATYQALILAAFLGYLPVYIVIWRLGVRTLDEPTFWFLILSIGPLLGIIAYHAVARRIYKC
jgi:hypothetical protein